jgi:hypothetical protein
MFSKLNTYVDVQIDRIVSALQYHEPHEQEYNKLLSHLERLQKIRQEEKPDRISADMKLAVGANLLGILLILKHENMNVITSKALSFVFRAR